MLLRTTLVFFLAVVVSCKRDPGAGGETGNTSIEAPRARPVPGSVQRSRLSERTGEGAPLFQRVDPGESGLDFVHRWEPRDKSERDQLAGAFAGGAVALGDIDDDGLPEVFLTRPHGGARLYRNLGGFRFEDASEELGLGKGGEGFWATGATFVDIQGDGHLDLYVCAYGMPNKLFVNTGAGRFVERADALGLAYSGASVMMSFADYDKDGDLDAHLLTNRLAGGERPPGLRFEVVDGEVFAPEAYRDEVGAILKKDGSLHPIDAGQADRLYRNDGGAFVEVSGASGMTGHHHGLSATWWDYDSDGWIDLYVANDFYGPDHLYRNNGDGTFTDVIAGAVPNTPWFSMGSDAGDLNGDGRLDLIATDMAATTHYKQKVNMGDMDEDGWFLELPTPRQYMRNAVYINTGTPRFLEGAYMAGLSATDWTWAVRIADYDSDGRNDVFFTNGMTREFFHADLRARVREIHAQTGENRWSDQGKLEEQNRFYRGLGGLRFEDVSADWGIDGETVSFGAACGDLDGDGDLDLVVNDFESPAGLFRNNSRTGNLIKITLCGAGANRRAVGAEVRARAGAVEQVRVVQPARGFMGCDPAEVVFGFGDAEQVDSLTVRWPSGTTQVLEGLEVGHAYQVSETDAPEPHADAPVARALFVESALAQPPQHSEHEFDDFARQPLLPNRLSTPGPAMAWGDLTGNGRVDLFLGGARGFPAQLWLANREGELRRQRIPFFLDHGLCEDVDAVIFDADGDGDPDLYVVSGGVEGVEGGTSYQDRLYLSVEGGLRVASDGALPDMNFSGACAAAADVDGDGDIDLFVGSRVIPGRYPTSGASKLLLNDGSGKFTVAPDAIAPELANAGMVTDALWSDVDGDGDPDLLVTTEYGPVRLYRNGRGTLVEASAEAGLAVRLGWWNCIAAADVDGDGDTDFALGNFGLNTKYKATPENPQLLYYGDFDGRGESYCVEAHLADGKLVPLRGRSCSSDAMPFIKQKFENFHEFAIADLGEIYTPPKLQGALKLEANELASGILLNDGSGRFSFRALPPLAQMAPCLGLAFLDADGDGNPDLYVSQNFYGPQRETGRMAGGVGAMLLGRGDGEFREVWPADSGIVVPGDARFAEVVDLNADGRDDLAIAVNNGPLRVFLGRGGGRSQ